MSISTIYFMKNFVAPTSGNDYLIKTGQAADAEEMARVYLKNLNDIIAVNNGIDANDEKFTPVDAMIAGGGDGHTFMYTVTLARTVLAASQQLLLGQQVIPVTPTGPAPFTGLPIPKDVSGPPYNNPTLGPINNDPGIDQPDPIPPFWVAPEFFITNFGLAASQEEVQAAHNALVDEIIAFIAASTPPGQFLAGFYCPFQGIAGAAKGTRFMVTVTGVPILAPIEGPGFALAADGPPRPSSLLDTEPLGPTFLRKKFGIK